MHPLHLKFFLQSVNIHANMYIYMSICNPNVYINIIPAFQPYLNFFRNETCRGIIHKSQSAPFLPPVIFMQLLLSAVLFQHLVVWACKASAYFFLMPQVWESQRTTFSFTSTGLFCSPLPDNIQQRDFLLLFLCDVTFCSEKPFPFRCGSLLNLDRAHIWKKIGDLVTCLNRYRNFLCKVGKYKQKGIHES